MAKANEGKEAELSSEPLGLRINRKTVYRKSVDVRWLLLTFALVLAFFYLAFDVPFWALFTAFAVLFTLVIGGGMKSRTKLKPPSALGSKEDASVLDRGMKSVVNALPNPCYVVDYRGTTQYVNAAAQKRFGIIALGDPLSFRIRAPSLLEALDRVAHGGTSEIIEWSEKVPMELWLEAHISPLWSVAVRRSGGQKRPGLILVVIRDLTETKRLERMRADFVANASHELRTPLASLTGFIETLQGPAKNDEVARERFLAIMLEQAERMRRLIDDLLSLSRIEMKVHVLPETIVDLRDVLKHSVDSLAPIAKELEVDVSIEVPDAPVVVRGEKDELIQVVHNLAENALKYGGSGGKVDLKIERVSGSQDVPEWLLSVKDYGPGIPPEHLPRLTERFYRVDTQTSRQMKGTGLGLAIVKHILTRHRARLEIDSHLGEGATFRIFIPGAVSLITEMEED
ncbi:two-component sensor histidine kinase [Rhodobacteraceae bacterium RKSG542]|uniref:ATP-binding protein n=1 Tax=Pseudovibrio flavus TaxID=2529854 RepID=UPI0012BB7A40|nr:ATP-binding protein [Pseudovibrio flavus]MTI18758.1 two-component sensor histidine kinase [Pseudovibrio flavus]